LHEKYDTQGRQQQKTKKPKTERYQPLDFTSPITSDNEKTFSELGAVVGISVGSEVVGLLVGKDVVGLALGVWVGELVVGSAVGDSVVGLKVGNVLGETVGLKLGRTVG